MANTIGIDDAGRGPVIGPMVLAGVLIDDNDEEAIKGFGVKDSKLLTSSKRGEIRRKIVKNFKHHIEISTPKEIDDFPNLNSLEAVKVAMVINKLIQGLNEKVKVIVDCPSVNIDKWSGEVKGLLKSPEKVELICEHKADLNYPVVSAASIIAKERREEELRELRKKFGVDFGSGYPSDPKTIDFIKENFNNPRYKSIIRFSWKTVKKLFESEGQNSLEGF